MVAISVRQLTLNCTILSESYKTSDEIRRIWSPKKDESVIHDKDSYSMDGGNKVYNFDSFAYQLPESTDFGKLSYIGHFQLEDGTIYRY